MHEFSEFTGLAEAEAGRDASVEHTLTCEEAENTRLLLCQALLKCADISNPVSPGDVLGRYVC
jgi:hypothetical protein